MSILPKKNPMPTLDPKERVKCFDEVALGYNEKTALDEAARCLNCKNKPCVAGCPVCVDIPRFIEKTKVGDFEGAYSVISKSSALPAVCGRVCPQEKQCEKFCTLGIKHEPVAIGRLERFVADFHLKNAPVSDKKPKPNGHRVAAVGSGPASLTLAGDLLKKGYAVTVFEALHTAGGVLVYGIPEFRLPKAIVGKEIAALKALGAEIRTNVVIGKTLTIDELLESGYEAVFIGSGAGLPKFMNIPGETLKGVLSANEFLTRVNLMKAYESGSATPIIRAAKTIVVGGGNVAMDAARCAARLGSKVTVVYRRTIAELPARKEEVEHAMEEGIEFVFLANPAELQGDENGCVKSVVCRKMKLSEPDASGRAKPVEAEGREFSVDADCVIMALGTSPNPLIVSSTKGLETTPSGCLVVTESGCTTKKGVFAGGDAVTGAATVILAMGAGKTAAKAIDDYLSEKSV